MNGSETREMTADDLVETFEREAGEPWFRTENGERVTRVSPPYPGIVPTWPALIRERARSAALDEVEEAVGELDVRDFPSRKWRTAAQFRADLLAAIASLRDKETAK